VYGYSQLRFIMMMQAERGRKVMRCAGNMPKCMDNAQWNEFVNIMTPDFAHTVTVLNQEEKNCLYKVATNPATGSPNDRFPADKFDVADRYYGALLDAM
jgi:hypothetical protein